MRKEENETSTPNNLLTPNYLGGSKVGKAVDDIETYPLSEFEYHIILDIAKESKFDNFDAMALSIGISFLISGLTYLLTTTFIEDTNLEIWRVAVCSIQFILGFTGTLIFLIKYYTLKNQGSPFNRLNRKICLHLNIEENES